MLYAVLLSREDQSQQQQSFTAPTTSDQSSFRITSLMREPEPYQPGPLAALLSEQRPPPPRVDEPKTASEQFRENRKFGDYSREIGDKEKNRLLKHIDASYKRLSLGSELGRQFMQSEESQEHAQATSGGADLSQRTRRSLDWETENSVLGSSLMNRSDVDTKHSTPLDRQHLYTDSRLSRDVNMPPANQSYANNTSTNQSYSPYYGDQSDSSIRNRVPDGQSSYSPTGNKNLNNNLIPSPTSGFSKFVSSAAD